ncbi:MAG TPA: GNAT family N-acetyltransferase [Solirubrobacteraceae bacterium]|nr:GNAT family N-acetyltransferase [Solirubrobacteraceae bacterium]
MIEIRSMTFDDVLGVATVVRAAGDQLARRAGREPRSRTDEQREKFLIGLRRFVELDPGGTWVAAEGDSVVGMVAAIRRDSFWGLSMLFVDPEQQNRGLGRALLDAGLVSSAGAEIRMILSSADPRALRRYSRAGLDIHPTVQARGTIDPRAIPDNLSGRTGNANDLDLVASVDARLRGSRAEDVGYLLGGGASLQIIDRGAARGYAVHGDKRLMMLGATDDATAAVLLWRFLAEAGEAEIWGLIARQNWAVKVALAARLEVAAAGALFLAGREDPPGPWLPSGWYF